MGYWRYELDLFRLGSRKAWEWTSGRFWWGIAMAIAATVAKGLWEYHGKAPDGRGAALHALIYGLAIPSAAVLLVWLVNIVRAPFLRDCERLAELERLRKQEKDEHSTLQRQAAAVLRRFDQWTASPAASSIEEGPYRTAHTWDHKYERFGEALDAFEREAEESPLPIADRYLRLCGMIRSALSSNPQKPQGKHYYFKLKEAGVMKSLEELVKEEDDRESAAPD